MKNTLRVVAVVVGLALVAGGGWYLFVRAPFFHGYFYTYAVHGGRSTIGTFPLSPPHRAAFQTVLRQPLEDLDELKYWRSYARFMSLEQPQAYIAWNQKSYWIIEAEKIGKDHAPVPGTLGIHLIEITQNRFRYTWYPYDKDRQSEALRELIRTAWDWEQNNIRPPNEGAMTRAEIDKLGELVDWTNDFHQTMNSKYPVFEGPGRKLAK